MKFLLLSNADTMSFDLNAALFRGIWLIKTIKFNPRIARQKGNYIYFA